MYKKVFLLVLISLNLLQVYAQNPIVATDTLQSSFTDSLSATPLKVIDTITPKFLMPLDSASKSLIADSLRKGFGYQEIDFDKLINEFLEQSASTSIFQKGNKMPKGEIWVLGILVVLLIFFAILKSIFSKQLAAIVQSFFSNRALVNLNKEDNLFTSWPFISLFIQFGFTIGLFCYLVAIYKGVNSANNGLQFFLTVSILIIVLYVFKLILLRLLGFVFHIQKPVNEYISTLCLSYFNAGLLFIPLVVAFALSPVKYGSIYLAIAVVLLIVIFVFQFIRASINILSHYKFPKVYLFLYFCTLEICPILILIKAIGFKGN